MSAHKPVIGVLALQGCVEPHKAHIEAAGGRFAAVKTAQEIANADALILPGGESTTMLRLLHAFDLWEILAAAVREKPTWGICAGAILLAQNVQNPTQESLGALPMTAVRNAYGRQVDSHHAIIDDYPVAFIRAPKFTNIGPDVEILATFAQEPVWVRYGPIMASAFHAELCPDAPSPMHRLFIQAFCAHAPSGVSCQ